VPESIIAFFDSTCYEDAVRKAVSLGGDSDTMACMAGAIAEAYYGGVPKDIVDQVRTFLPDDLREITSRFCAKYYDLSVKTLDD
jgi:ADP-ribosylglycohydrolase